MAAVRALSGAALESYKERQYDFSDPNRFGRGAWQSFMVSCLDCQSEMERLHLCRQMRAFCKYIKCGACGKDCKAYYEDHPPEPHAAVSNDALFEWIVSFMSAVNVKIGKPPYESSRLKKLFSDADVEVCQADCGAASASKKVELSITDKMNADQWLKQHPSVVSIGAYSRPSQVNRSEWKAI